jgi:D-sedoheptulose 7-phosphate isomerase
VSVRDSNGSELDIESGLAQWTDLSRGLSEHKRRQWICGNGASAAFANHMALDWTKNGGIPTFSISDSALITALANDMGVESMFSAPIGWLAESGDVLVTVSSSGNSPNIIRAIETAREKRMKVVTLSGLQPDNASRKMGDLNFYIPGKTYGVVECTHQILLHMWLDQFLGVREWDRDTLQNMSADAFQL